jgi:serine/threonine-protein kinase
MMRDRTDQEAQALFERGQQAIQQGDHREAVECLTRAIRLRPDVAIAYRYRAYAYREMGDRISALNDLDVAIRLKPDDPQAYADRAAALFAQKAYEQAIADCDYVLRLDPGRADIYGLRGRCYAELGDSQRALQDYAEAIRGDPEQASVYVQWRAELHLDCQQPHDLLTDSELLIQLTPNQPTGYFLRGMALALLKRFEEALQDYHTALTIAPGHKPTLLARAHAYLQLGRASETEADCTAYLQQDPEAASLYELRGLARKLQGRWQEATADLTEAIRRAPSVDRYNWRAQMHYFVGDYAAAVQDHMEALKLDPHHPGTFNMLAWIWSTCPDPDFRNGPRARDCATRACELTEWSEPAYLDTLAAACAECGDYEQALKWANCAIELLKKQPDFSEARLQDYMARSELYRQRQPFRTPPGPTTQLPAWGI